MARQPVVSALLLAAVFTTGCRNDLAYEGAFDVPIGVAVLPTHQGPFDEPIGLVANAHGGQIATLALKQGRFVTDDVSASFLRGNWIPTGGARVLSSVAVWSPSTFDIQVFAGDRAYQQLVQVPWIVGSQTKTVGPVGAKQSVEVPLEEGPTSGSACFVPAGATFDPATDACPGGGSVDLNNIDVKHGYTSTETWTVTWSEVRDRWTIDGSRSGRQEFLAKNGIDYIGDKRRVAFKIVGSSQGLNDGDRLVFSTESGLIEHDVGGIPQFLAMSPDQSLLAMIVHDAVLDAPVLRWFDPASGTVTGEVSLPAEARPHRLAWSDDGATLFFADTGYPAAWEVALGATTPTEHAMPWPTYDVAPLSGDANLLYVVPEDTRSVWITDLDTDTFLDLSPSVEGVQGRDFGTAVSGIASIPLEYRFQQTHERRLEKRIEGRSVAVSLISGRVVFMEETTGCLVQDRLGPRTRTGSNGAGDLIVVGDPILGPSMTLNAQNDRHIQVNACAGIALGENWAVRYNALLNAWEVSSTKHGDHERLAYEDQRYVSDNGEVNFTIRAGTVPSQDGWSFEFGVDEGSLEATGDNDGDGIREVPLNAPGDPVYFHFVAGSEHLLSYDFDAGTAFTVSGKTDRPHVLIPSQSSDNVARVNPETGSAEVRWD
ncbi:MAG: hypothetical protein GWP91_13080 [Rhodobacterales bacterium]|nr:hypothetical protein [Rhodobacterales bacterium]